MRVVTCKILHGAVDREREMTGVLTVTPTAHFSGSSAPSRNEATGWFG
jgi:hypothetical protein